MMFYIHQTICVSPQQTCPDAKIGLLKESVDNKLEVIDPSYAGIPAAVLRRMSKSVKFGVAAALPILQHAVPADGIIIGTGNGGMEDSVRFLKQIVEYKEDVLAPGTFVQSTANSIASQVALLSNNKGYNITHVHRGLAFENAVIDVAMLLAEQPLNNYLLGGVDEISSYNFNLEYLDCWYKKEKTSNKYLYETDTPGSIAGEGAVMFLVNTIKAGARAELRGIATLHTRDEYAVKDRLLQFIGRHLGGEEKIDLFLSGENGDNRLLKFYSSCEAVLEEDVTVARFKHMSGEYPTAQAFAVWLACQLTGSHILPSHMVKKSSVASEFKNVLIYNNYRGVQHSFILVSKAGRSTAIFYGS